VSPDGQWLAVAQPDSRANLRIAIMNLQRPNERRWLTGDKDGLWEHRTPSWSPDGRLLCYAAGRDLWIVPVGQGNPHRVTSDGEVDFDPAWSPDGRYIYFSSYREGTSALWRVASTGGTPARLTDGTGPERDPDAARDGARLTYTTYTENPDVVFRDLVTGEEQSQAGPRDEDAPALSADARWLVFGSDRWGGRFDLWIQPLTNARTPAGPARRLTDHAGSVAQPAFSHDGNWVAYHRVLGGQRDIWIVPARGGAPAQFTADRGIDAHPDWSPDDSALVFVSDRRGSLRVWMAPVKSGRPAGPAVQLSSGDTEDEAPVWSRDGEWIAFIGKSPGGDRDVWITRSDRHGRPERLTTGARAGRVRWDPASDGLLVSGFWNGPSISLRRVSRDGRVVSDIQPPVTFGTNPAHVHFDVSRDARLLVFARHSSRGDIWIVDAARGTF
jgi:Tol biopolymer transport system component